MGLVEYEKGNREAAIKKWQEVIAIDKEQAEPQLALAVALYKQGKTKEGLKMGEAALILDGRYGELKFLQENLWGDKLLQDTEAFLRTPTMQAVLARTTTSTVPVE
jgi:tetratricopeptide (TPR) repeat protein